MARRTATFKLSFSVDPQGVARALDAFLSCAPSVVIPHAELFEYWHASFHRDLFKGTHNELWFQFRASSVNAQELGRCLGSDLRSRAYGLGFGDLCVTIQDETTAFADVIAQIGGAASMDALWQQVQAATEWAISDLASGTERRTPREWYPWARHVYRNLLGLE